MDKAPTPLRRSQRIIDRQETKDRQRALVAETEQPPTKQPKKCQRKRHAITAAHSPPHKKVRSVPMLSGYLEALPQELLDVVLEKCSARQLAVLETSCRYFRPLVENIAQFRIKAIPRAKGLTPNTKTHEKYTSLLHFILGQSAAAAQATAIAFGAHHTAALLIANEDKVTGHHSLYTFGKGFYGQLGLGDYDNRPSPKHLCIGYQPSMDLLDMEEEITPAVVACGSNYTASITRRGQLLTWGLGSRGELGHDLPNSGEVPIPMRAYLASRPTVRIVSVACGGNHTLAISEQGCVWSCGRNNDGQLGTSSFADSFSLQRVSGIRGQRVVSCAAGVSHSMALASDGSLYTWGSGRYGQLGHSSLHAVHLMVPHQSIVLATPQKVATLEPATLKPWDRVTSIAAGGHHGCAVTVGGMLKVFGRNKHGQLGTGDAENRWRPTDVTISASQESNEQFRCVQVACGLQHTLALIAHQGRVKPYSTGANVWGQLGHGHQVPSEYFNPIAALLKEDVVALQAGDNTSAAICENGQVYLWGRNDCGQLGLKLNNTWQPTLLTGFTAVHPDKTLRKSKRMAPRMRPAVQPQNTVPQVLCNSTLAALMWGGQFAMDKRKHKMQSAHQNDMMKESSS